jgi:hypothetical protein
MVGMVSQFARYSNTISSRTIQSGGSVGGVKKPGLVTYGPSWKMGNMGNFLKRAPQKLPSLAFSLANTTRYPTQLRRGSYAVTHSGMLG